MNGARLIYLMGASGSGKDTLLRLLRAQLRADEPVIVAHRYITRDSGASEDALRLSEDEFSRREALGGFALRWSSHGLRYGIGVEMDAWLAGGAAVIVNGSRAHLPQAHARYPALTAVEIRVDPRCWRAGWPDAAGKAKPTSRGGWRAPPGISGTRRVPADTAGQQRGARRRGGGPAGPGPLGPVRRAEGGRHRDHGDPTLPRDQAPGASARAAFQQDGGERLFRHQRPGLAAPDQIDGRKLQPKSQGTLPSLPCWQTSAAMSSGSTETSVSSAASMSSITSVE